MTEYVAAAASKSDLERTELSKQKTGVFTGAANDASHEVHSDMANEQSLPGHEMHVYSPHRTHLGMCHAGSYAVNPANAEEIPIWVADYVLGGYGSGAIMVRRGRTCCTLHQFAPRIACQRGHVAFSQPTTIAAMTVVASQPPYR